MGTACVGIQKVMTGWMETTTSSNDASVRVRKKAPSREVQWVLGLINK